MQTTQRVRERARENEAATVPVKVRIEGGISKAGWTSRGPLHGPRCELFTTPGC